MKRSAGLPLTASLVALFLVCLASPCPAADPDAGQVYTKMKAALEPARPSLREIEIVIHGPGGASTNWHARQARKTNGDTTEMLTVLTEPEGVRGTAVLAKQSGAGRPEIWAYLPAVQRVRKMMPFDAFDSFLGTDFSYESFGFLAVADRSYKLLDGASADAGAYVLEEIPTDTYKYSKIVSTIAKDTFLPSERNYYDRAGTLWKKETLGAVKNVDGMVTPTSRIMEDVQSRTKTELQISRIAYDGSIPDSLFDPKSLAGVVDSSVWAGLGK